MIKGDGKMSERENLVGKMIIQMIKEGQISVDDEHEIKQAIEERDRKREEEKMGRCLAGAIDNALTKNVEAGSIKASTKRRYHSVFMKCFGTTRYGNMDAVQIKEATVKEFIIEAYESYGLNKNEMLWFMAMLHIGLKKLSEKGILNFEPDNDLYPKYLQLENNLNYISNPYYGDGLESLMTWIINHKDDVRGLAVGLWLLGEISPEEIINIKREDLQDSEGNSTSKPSVVKKAGSGRYLLLTNERSRILNFVLEYCADSDSEYVFVIKTEDVWKKLNNKSLQIKLYYICQEIRLQYKGFHYNDIIICDK